VTELTLTEPQLKKLREMFALASASAEIRENGEKVITIVSKQPTDRIAASAKQRRQLMNMFNGKSAEVTKIENSVIIVIVPQTLAPSPEVHSE